MDVADIIQSISIIIAALSVALGFSAWRREFVGKRRIELAEDVLALFYEAHDAIRYIRNPFARVGEGSSRKANESETPEEKQINDTAYVVFERYNNRQELFNKIHSMRYRFMAQFGKEAAQPFDDLHKTINDIFISAQMLTHYWLQQGRNWTSDEEFKEHLAKMNEYEAVFWEKSVDNDPISPRVNAILIDIENRCHTIIQNKTTCQRLWGWLCRYRQ